MKQIAYGMIVGLMMILGIVIAVTINGKRTRQDEIDNSLSIAVENAVETTMNEKTYTISNNKEFIADFTQSLLAQISNDSDVEVQVAKIDSSKGTIAIKVTEYFKHPNGKEGKNECETTVVFEHVPTNLQSVTITYMKDENNMYKEFQIAKGEPVIVPKNPTMDGKIFAGWKDTNGNVVTITGKADSNATYVATWK